jgi:hypothetical protein
MLQKDYFEFCFSYKQRQPVLRSSWQIYPLKANNCQTPANLKYFKREKFTVQNGTEAHCRENREREVKAHHVDLTIRLEPETRVSIK